MKEKKRVCRLGPRIQHIQYFDHRVNVLENLLRLNVYTLAMLLIRLAG